MQKAISRQSFDELRHINPVAVTGTLPDLRLAAVFTGHSTGPAPECAGETAGVTITERDGDILYRVSRVFEVIAGSPTAAAVDQVIDKPFLSIGFSSDALNDMPESISEKQEIHQVRSNATNDEGDRLSLA